MRDDFDLFGNPDDGEQPLDAELALITAYLARELSPMQVLAVEERLVSDTDFRATVQPVIDAWAAPVASLGGAIRTGTLSEDEKLESWRRFQRETSTGASSAPAPARRISMKRVAAVIGVTVLPMVTFAQAVVYSAKHEAAPGHAIAQRIVAVFGRADSPALDRGIGLPVVPVGDEPVSRQLVTPPFALSQATVSPALPIETVSAPQKPDRARVIALAREHHASIVRGDTAVNYIVMVLDAAGKYLWSTSGNGSVLFEVAGDTRTASERDRDNQINRAELMGSASGGGAGRKVLSVGPDRARGGRGGTFGSWLHRDSMYRKGYDTLSLGYFVVFDSLRDSSRLRGWVNYDSGGSIVRGYRQSDTTALAKSGVGRGRGGFFGDSTVPNAAHRTYRNGFVSTEYGPAMNQAPGLQELGNGQSGVQGLPAKSVSSSETYLFAAGELAPTAIRVIVVNLVPGINWRR